MVPYRPLALLTVTAVLMSFLFMAGSPTAAQDGGKSEEPAPGGKAKEEEKKVPAKLPGRDTLTGLDFPGLPQPKADGTSKVVNLGDMTGVVAYLDTLTNADLDILKAVAVPYFNDGKGLIATEDELKADIQKLRGKHKLPPERGRVFAISNIRTVLTGATHEEAEKWLASRLIGKRAALLAHAKQHGANLVEVQLVRNDLQKSGKVERSAGEPLLLAVLPGKTPADARVIGIAG